VKLAFEPGYARVVRVPSVRVVPASTTIGLARVLAMSELPARKSPSAKVVEKAPSLPRGPALHELRSQRRFH
jgi:hypothetical protein